MKKTIKLIPAIVMLLVSAILVSTSTYAWFSMNNRVTVTGMTITTKIQDNLQISEDTLASTARKAESTFTNGLNQVVTGLLEPVSTVNGTAFFYTKTNNVKADGDAITDAYEVYTAGDTFDINYGVNTTADTADAVGYVDYVFQLKATNTDEANTAALKLTKVNLLYNDAAAAANEIKAYRVAVFVENITNAAPAGGVGTLKTILRQSGAQYFSNPYNYAVTATNAAPSVAVTNLDTAATLADVTAGATEYFKVVVRMWLEGEDTTCNSSTYLSLTKDWTLDLVIELGGANGAAENITTVAGAVATASGATGTVTLDAGNLTNGETPVTYAWKNAADGSDAAGTNNAASYTATASGNFYCLITTVRGSVYKTNTVSLTVS